MSEIVQLSDSVKLICADCVDVLPVECDVCLTDPPYEISASGGGIGGRREYLTNTRGFTDCGFDYSVLDSFPNWVCFGTLKQIAPLMQQAGERRTMLVTWNKPNPCPLVQGNYLPDTEYIIHAFSAGCLYGDFKDRSRFIVHRVGDKEDGRHPNEKPVKVITKMLRLCSAEGQTVCDPFMGSGTTGIACIRNKRKFIGIERDPKWFKVAVDRLQKELDQGVFEF